MLVSQKEKLIRPRSGASLIRELKDKELSYSKGNIYHDLRRNASFFKSKTSEAEDRAQDWFDNYFEPFRKSKGLTARQAHELWIAAKSQSYDHLTRAELEFALELREIGSP